MNIKYELGSSFGEPKIRTRRPYQQYGLNCKYDCQPLKKRWEIELLLKTMNQNVQIKTLVGTNANALKS